MSVITEVIITVFTKDTLTDEERESRDEFLAILEEHILDVAAHVRSKVFQFWARLHSETAIPLKLQNIILESIIPHLHDKGALARKNAAACVTKFLTHNPYGGEVILKKKFNSIIILII